MSVGGDGWNQKYHRQIFSTQMNFWIVYNRNRTVARRFCESSRPFLCRWNMYYKQQRCTNKISNPKPISQPQPSLCVYQNILPPFYLLAAIHLFISSRDEIKISARWIWGVPKTLDTLIHLSLSMLSTRRINFWIRLSRVAKQLAKPLTWVNSKIYNSVRKLAYAICFSL